MAAQGKWMASNFLRFVMATVLVSGLASAGITCPPIDKNNPGPTMEEIYYYSDVVVMGKVTEKYPVGASSAGNSEVYTAEMEVYCVYKGDNVASLINITNAGKPPNLCFSTDFKVGTSYMVYLKQVGNGKLIPAYQQHPEGYKDEMIFICNITISLPLGLNELPAGVKCEDKPDDDYEYECFSFKPPKDETYKTEDSKEGNEEEANDNRNGFEPLRLSLLLLALGHMVIWVFS